MQTKYITAHYPTLVSNIRLNYYAAKQYPVLLKSGLTWYKNSNQTIQEMADRYRISSGLRERPQFQRSELGEVEWVVTMASPMM